MWEKKAENEDLGEKPFTCTFCRNSDGVCAGLGVNRMLRRFHFAFRLKTVPAGGIKFKLKEEIFLVMHTVSACRVQNKVQSGGA